MTFLAKQWVDDGLDIDTVLTKLEDLKQRQTSIFVVDTLEYLYKNGRIGTAKNLFGSILEIKPILGLVDGAISAVESQRTQKRAVARMIELTVEQYPKNVPGHLTLTHAGVPERAKDVAQQLKTRLGLEADIPIYNLPPAIMVHVGPGTIAAQFFTENNH
jgi:DegV family protein with EDD domain